MSGKNSDADGAGEGGTAEGEEGGGWQCVGEREEMMGEKDSHGDGEGRGIVVVMEREKG